MAGEATIGALRVILGADTAKFEDNLKSAASSLESFGKKITSIAAGIGLERAFEKTFSAIVDSVQKAIDVADKLAKASQKFGIPVETLSALSAAASLSDVSLEQLGSSLSKMAKSAIAAQAPTSEQAAALRALGISAKDFIKLNAEDRILALADAFAQFADGPAKTAAAIALFGRAGADMIPFLNQSASGIKPLTDRMKELGIVISSETAAAAEKYNDDLKILALAKDAIILRILGSSGMLAAMNKLTESMTDAAGESSKLAESLGTALGGSLQETTRFLQETRENAAGLVRAWDDLKAAWNAFANARNAEGLAKMGDALRDVGIMTTEESKRLKDAHEQLELFRVNFSGVNEALERYIKLTETKKDLPFAPNADKLTMAFNDQLAKLHSQALEISGVFAGRLAPGFLASASGMEILKGQIKLTADGLVTLGPLAEKWNQAMLEVQGQKILQDLIPVWDQLPRKVAAYDAALVAVGATAQQIADVNFRLAAGASEAWGTAMASITGNIASGFAQFAKQNKELSGVAKAAAYAQAIFSTYASAAKGLELYGPTPLGFAAAAAAVIAGLGYVAQISAQKFAKGGSFKVPGGISGVDSMMMPLALAPGERVDITPSGQERDRGAGREITLNGVGPRDLFTGAMLRDLVDVLNQGHRDGYRLKVGER